MSSYTISLSNVEDFALSWVAVNQGEWIGNAVHERCRIAIDEIVKISVDNCLANNIQIPGSKDEIVELAVAQGWVKSLADQQLEAKNNIVGE